MGLSLGGDASALNAVKVDRAAADEAYYPQWRDRFGHTTPFRHQKQPDHRAATWHIGKMETTPTPENVRAHDCPACNAIDEADGVVDGNLFPVLATRIGHSKHVVERLKGVEDRTADRITAFAGSLPFVYIHSVWFGIWIALNVGLFGAAAKFDPFPFGLLTMIVSLEAIFLATFVMVSQNRQAARYDLRSQIDFETNLRSEIWSVHIGNALGIDIDHVETVVRRAIDGSHASLSS